MQEALDSVQGTEGLVIRCLQDFRADIQGPVCKKQVHRVVARGAEDFRFNAALKESCSEDRQRLCPDIEPVRLCCIPV
jgi:hypothetical protein